MPDLINFFNQGWIGSLLGVIGIISSIYFYKNSKSIAKPAFQKRALHLLGRKKNNLPSEVDILFKGRKVERLTKTTIIIWNNGNHVLEGKDIVSSDPIQISFKENDEILSYRTLKTTKHVNNFSLTQITPYKLSVTFDYLDPSDGATVEILHNSEEKYPTISGTIKGIPEGFVDFGRVYSANRNKLSINLFHSKILINQKHMFLIAAFLGTLMIIYGCLSDEMRRIVLRFLSRADKATTEHDQSFFIVMGGLYILLPIFDLWSRRRKYPKDLYLAEIDE